MLFMKSDRLVIVHSPKSTHAQRFDRAIRPRLVARAERRGGVVSEIQIENTPYFEACQIIADGLQPGDTVLSAGGDGTAQATLRGPSSRESKV
jgi:diacylglycerol kinase family enzyme